MTGFFIKKSFFDGWDNLISLVILNLGYLLVLLTFYGAFELFQVAVAPAIFLIIIALAFNSFYSALVSYQTLSYVKGRKASFHHFISGIKILYKHALFHLGLSILITSIAIFVIPFYLSYGSGFTFVLAVIIFWVLLLALLALLYYYPLAIRMNQDSPFKTAKKALLIVADNIFFTLFFAVYQIVLFVMTIFFATIMPGIAGLALSKQVAVTLLMYKYDYLEEHPQTKRNEIPWEELLYEEREKIGHRSFRSLIFPWKD